MGLFSLQVTSGQVLCQPDRIGKVWQRIVQANSGILLHYSYGEDHGWVIEVCKGSERYMIFQHWWDDSLDEEFDDLAPSCPFNNPDITFWLNGFHSLLGALKLRRHVLKLTGRTGFMSLLNLLD